MMIQEIKQGMKVRNAGGDVFTEIQNFRILQRRRL